MVTESGGKGPRDGFRYQDYAAAYFFVTDHPETHESDDPPLELHIEQDDSDFSYFLRNTENETGHHFEAKHQEGGELKWSKYKSEVLPEFMSIYEESPRPTDIDVFHTVVNTSFARRVNTVLSDARKLRTGEYTTLGLWNRRQREYKDLLMEELDPEEPDDLLTLVRFLVGHTLPEEMLENKLLNFLERCNPRGPKKSNRIVLETIRDTSSGVISRDELEDKLGHRLKPVQESSVSSTKTEDLRDNLSRIRQKLPRNNPRDLYERAQFQSEELNKRVAPDDDIQERRVESEAARVTNAAEGLIDLSDEVHEREYTLSKGIESLLDQADSHFEDEDED